MLTLVLLTLGQLASPAPRVIVIDISAGDAIYEDISRGLAEQVVTALNQVGCQASRVDETELPRGCKVGPCLGRVAEQRQADIVVTLDAQDEGAHDAKVVLSSLRGVNGEFLGGAKYTVTPGGKVTPAPLTQFAEASLTALTDEKHRVAVEPKKKVKKSKKKKPAH